MQWALWVLVQFVTITQALEGASGLNNPKYFDKGQP